MAGSGGTRGRDTCGRFSDIRTTRFWRRDTGFSDRRPLLFQLVRLREFGRTGQVVRD
jgi:hypothetical protein